MIRYKAGTRAEEKNKAGEGGQAGLGSRDRVGEGLSEEVGLWQEAGWGGAASEHPGAAGRVSQAEGTANPKETQLVYLRAGQSPGVANGANSG